MGWLGRQQVQWWGRGGHNEDWEGRDPEVFGCRCATCRKGAERLVWENQLRDLLPTGSEEREVLEVGVFLLQYFPLVKI